ncbi:RecA-like recombination protein [Cellulosimicrobium phage DS1]|nr:RecA-like recombination protein [Cellulosimicrobium phage DS1]
MISAWDPGGTTGWAIWDDSGNLQNMGDCPLDKITETWQWLEATYGKITVVVIEDYRLFYKRAKKQAGSNMPASQGIGMLKAIAQLGNAEVVIQPPDRKTIGMRWAGMAKMPADHAKTHSLDAYVHGFYYMHGKGIVKSALELKKDRENGRTSS